MWVQKRFLPPTKNRNLAQKRPNLAKNTRSWSFWPNIGHLGPFGAMTDQKNNANEVSRWFSDMWVSKLLLTPKMIRMFGPKYAFLPAGSVGALLFGGLARRLLYR